MGHLFSRAFRRITQCSQSRNSSTQQQAAEQQHSSEQDTNQQQAKPASHETIPVGQSIDSFEYRTLDGSSQQPIDSNSNDQENRAPTSGTNAINCVNENNKDVEGAVIKIQALVRGHLTRKALKDAHQHGSTPAQNALGQCQFDEESLTRNPPSAVFLHSSPLILNNNHEDFSSKPNSKTTLSNSDQQHQASRTPLESIAEVTETPPQLQDTGINDTTTTTVNKHSSRSSAEPSKLEMPLSDVEPRTSSGGLESPSSTLSTALSEVTTSIDLDHEAPTSASILISDHNIKPADRIASVLYFKDGTGKQGVDTSIKQLRSGGTELPSVGISSHDNDTHNETVPNNIQQQQNILATDSLDSEEAAAIRIQSAFRGYRTRKNSPYRTRSPSNSIDAAAKRNNGPHQQDVDTCVLNERTTAEEQFEDEANEAARTAGRRTSRQRHRNLSQDTPEDNQQQQQRTSRLPDQEETNRFDEQQAKACRERVIQGAPSLEEFTTTEDTTTVKEAILVPSQQIVAEASFERETPCQVIDQSAAEALESVKWDELNSDSHRADAPSLLLDMSVGLLSEEANTLDEAGLSAALEAGHETNNTDELAESGGILVDSSCLMAPRPSETSVELDTDSSVLGAALSLNEDTSLANNDLQAVATSPVNQVIRGPSQSKTIADDDKSQGVSLMTDELEFESEARELVEELEQYDSDPLAPPETPIKQEGEFVEERLESSAIEEHANLAQELNEEEQRAIELESDEIERRDPRGQASEERSKSPQIRLEAVAASFTDDDVAPENRGEEAGDNEGGRGVEEVIVSSQSTGAYLGVQPADEGTSSERSSPALNSSEPNSSASDSGDNNTDNEGDSPTNKQQQARGNQQASAYRQQQNNQQTGKNKKRNRKRRGKK